MLHCVIGETDTDILSDQSAFVIGVKESKKSLRALWCLETLGSIYTVTDTNIQEESEGILIPWNFGKHLHSYSVISK